MPFRESFQMGATFWVRTGGHRKGYEMLSFPASSPHSLALIQAFKPRGSWCMANQYECSPGSYIQRVTILKFVP